MKQTSHKKKKVSLARSLGRAVGRARSRLRRHNSLFGESARQSAKKVQRLSRDAWRGAVVQHRQSGKRGTVTQSVKDNTGTRWLEVKWDRVKQLDAVPFADVMLLNGTRVKNVDGYIDANGQFRPIRASENYNEFLAKDFEPRPSRRKPDHELSLSEFVRREGGMKVDRDKSNRGELMRLSRKEAGTTGLVNNKSGQSVESMADNAREAGYRVPRNPNQFLEAVEGDLYGYKKVWHPEKEYDYTDRRGNPARRKRARSMPLFEVLDAQPRRVRLVHSADWRGAVVGERGDFLRVKWDHYPAKTALVAKDEVQFINPGHATRATTARAKTGATRRANAAPVMSKVLDVTPELAKQLLKLNVGNRPVSFAKVDSIRKEIKKGTFKRDEPITFTNGVLTNGQHTLMAIAEAGKAVRLKVVSKQLAPLRLDNPVLDTLGHLAAIIGNWPAAAALYKKVKEKVTGPPKKNPAPARAPENVKRIYSEFQGRENSGENVELFAPATTPDDVAWLGELVELKIVGQRKLWTFENNPAVLGASGGDKKRVLHIGLEQQYATPAGAGADEWIVFGEVEHVVYRTSKPHLYKSHATGREDEFIHPMGEEGGRRPRLALRHGVLWLLGPADYEIKPEGIRN